MTPSQWICLGHGVLWAFVVWANAGDSLYFKLNDGDEFALGTAIPFVAGAVSFWGAFG